MPHEARADADLGEHLGGIEELALGLRPRLFPPQLHRAVRREEAGEVAALALGPRRARELELRISAQAPQHDRLQQARGDVEVHRLPRIVPVHGGVELEHNRELAAAVEDGDVAVTLHFDAPVLGGGRFGQRDGAREQFQRSAAVGVNVRRGGQGEGGLVAAQVADELEVVESDRRGGRQVGGRGRGGGEQEHAEERGDSFHITRTGDCECGAVGTPRRGVPRRPCTDASERRPYQRGMFRLEDGALAARGFGRASKSARRGFEDPSKGAGRNDVAWCSCAAISRRGSWPGGSSIRGAWGAHQRRKRRGRR